MIILNWKYNTKYAKDKFIYMMQAILTLPNILHVSFEASPCIPGASNDSVLLAKTGISFGSGPLGRSSPTILFFLFMLLNLKTK